MCIVNQNDQKDPPRTGKRGKSVPSGGKRGNRGKPSSTPIPVYSRLLAGTFEHVGTHFNLFHPISPPFHGNFMGIHDKSVIFRDTSHFSNDVTVRLTEFLEAFAAVLCTPLTSRMINSIILHTWYYDTRPI